MDGWNNWRGPDELLKLFGIDPDSDKWAGIWCGLVALRTLGIKYPEYPLGLDQIATGWMRSEHISPVVYWSRIKSSLRPILDADRETLNALGLYPVGINGRSLAEAAAQAMVDGGWSCDEQEAAQLARALRALERRDP